MDLVKLLFFTTVDYESSNNKIILILHMQASGEHPFLTQQTVLIHNNIAMIFPAYKT